MIHISYLHVLCPTIEVQVVHTWPIPHHTKSVLSECLYQCILSNHLLTFKNVLTHWGRMRHICVGKTTIIGSDNGLSPGRRQAIIWTNAGILLIGTLGTHFSEILSEIHTFSFSRNSIWNVVCEIAAILFKSQCVNTVYFNIYDECY